MVPVHIASECTTAPFAMCSAHDEGCHSFSLCLMELNVAVNMAPVIAPSSNSACVVIVVLSMFFRVMGWMNRTNLSCISNACSWISLVAEYKSKMCDIASRSTCESVSSAIVDMLDAWVIVLSFTVTLHHFPDRLKLQGECPAWCSYCMGLRSCCKVLSMPSLYSLIIVGLPRQLNSLGLCDCVCHSRSTPLSKSLLFQV